MGALSAAGSILPALLTKPDKPPAAVVPGSPAPNARTPGATVRIGTGAKDERTEGVGPDKKKFVEQRKSGKALGGLGYSGLAL